MNEFIGYRNPRKYQGVMTDQQAKEKDQRKHDEATLHLQFCRWIKKEHPDLLFIRHEKEKKRSHFLGNLMQVYNSLDGIPDFELLEPIIYGKHEFGKMFNRLYIEFKKPGEYWLEARTGNVKKAYRHQYACHVKLWQKGSCAYFCNDLEIAKELFRAYLLGKPHPQQIYKLHL
jgi:hypothetical protein